MPGGQFAFPVNIWVKQGCNHSFFSSDRRGVKLRRTVRHSAAAHVRNRELMRSVDVAFGNEEDFSAALGFATTEADTLYSDLDADNFRQMIRRVVETFPNIKAICHHAAWGAIGCLEVTQCDIEIFDRSAAVARLPRVLLLVCSKGAV